MDRLNSKGMDQLKTSLTVHTVYIIYIDNFSLQPYNLKKTTPRVYHSHTVLLQSKAMVQPT